MKKQPEGEAETSLRQPLVNQSILTEDDGLNTTTDYSDLPPLTDEQKRRNRYERSKGELKPSNPFSMLFFTWIGSFLKFGSKNVINENSVPELPQHLRAKKLHERLAQNFADTPPSQTAGWRISKTALKTFKIDLLYCFVSTFFIIFTMEISPIVTNFLIKFVEQKTDITQSYIYKGILYFLAVILIMLLKQLAISHLWYGFLVFSYNFSNSLALMIYNKTLKYSLICRKKYSSADVINLNEVDLQRLAWIGYHFTTVISTPIQIIIGIAILAYYLGVILLPAIGFIFLSFAMTAFLSKISSRKNKQQLKRKDIRMKATEEIFNSIRFIKVNNFQQNFKQKLQKKRNDEVQSRISLYRIWSCFELMYWMYNAVLLSVTFATFIILGEELTTANAFTTIVLFRSLQYSIMAFPNSLSEVIMAWESLKRVEKFIGIEEINVKNVENCDGELRNSQGDELAIKITNGNFEWELEQKDQEEKKNDKKDKDNSSENSDEQKKKLQEKEKVITSMQVLHDINLEVKKGTFTMIIGDIGSGKSSLLYAIMNQMKAQLTEPIKVNGSISFSSQKPWIMAGTVRENICFLKQYDEQKFQEAIYHSNLTDDLKLFTKGDMTEIGQKGINLSGGQKARISFARSIYSQKDILLLDDILSAVDVHVGEFLVSETLTGLLRKQGRTIVMPTHAVKYLKSADEIVVMQAGKIVLQGNYYDIKQNEVFMKAVNICEKIEHQEQQEVGEIERKKSKQEQKEKEMLEEVQQLLRKKTPVQKLASPKIQANSPKLTENLLTEETLSQIEDLPPIEQKVVQQAKLIEALIIEEQKQDGLVQSSTYKIFTNLSGGIPILALITLLHFSWIVLSSISNIVIEKWCDNLQGITQDQTVTYLIYFVVFSIGSSFVMFFSALMFVRHSRILSTNAHEKAIDSLLKAGLNSFFNRVPTGRIINRFSKDIGKIDDELVGSERNTFITVFYCLGNVGMCIYASTPFALLPLIFVYILAYRLKNYYMKTKIECARLQSTSNSKIVDGIVSTMDGASSIRAYNLQEEFYNLQIKKIETNKKIRLGRQAVEGWFSIRMCLLTFLFITPVLLFCIFSTDISPALVGLVMTYTLILCQSITEVIQSFAVFQTEMVSIQRVDGFIKVRKEEDSLTQIDQTASKIITEQTLTMKQYPKSIEFQKVSLKYFENHPNIIDKVSFSIKKGEKIGIIGRTGSGKSTVFNSLLRIIDPSEGEILINGQNLTHFSLPYLRSSVMTIIDQDPVVFNSTFRENLDPSTEYSDEEIIQISQKSGLHSIISQRGGLSGKIANDSLSIGEKQLLSICRALLKKTEIVLIDEATANIDVKNDELIQKAIQQQFSSNTVLTIAHRISTLKNSDRILVLGDKGILQFDTPDELMKRENGIFRGMMEKNDKEYLM